VALGMLAAADIGAEMGLTPPELAQRQRALLERFGLLRELGDVRVEDVLAAIALDKKVEGKSVRWVLLEDVGRPVLHWDMPAEIVEGAVRRLLRR
jgi:3-dehydroquinate synthetase